MIESKRTIQHSRKTGFSLAFCYASNTFNISCVRELKSLLSKNYKVLRQHVSAVFQWNAMSGQKQLRIRSLPYTSTQSWLLMGINLCGSKNKIGLGGTINTCKSAFMSYLCTIYIIKIKYLKLWQFFAEMICLSQCYCNAMTRLFQCS